jgi:hypothetical protein
MKRADAGRFQAHSIGLAAPPGLRSQERPVRGTCGEPATILARRRVPETAALGCCQGGNRARSSRVVAGNFPWLFWV